MAQGVTMMQATTSIPDRWRNAPKGIRKMVTIWITTGILLLLAAAILWKSAFYDIKFASGLESMKLALAVTGLIFAAAGVFIVGAAIAFLQKLPWGRSVLEYLAWGIVAVLVGFDLFCTGVLLSKWTNFKVAVLPWEMPELLLIALVVIMALPIISGLKEIKKMRSKEIRDYVSR